MFISTCIIYFILGKLCLAKKSQTQQKSVIERALTPGSRTVFSNFSKPFKPIYVSWLEFYREFKTIIPRLIGKTPGNPFHTSLVPPNSRIRKKKSFYHIIQIRKMVSPYHQCITNKYLIFLHSKSPLLFCSQNYVLRKIELLNRRKPRGMHLY